MIDLYQAQEDLFQALLSAPQLRTVNVVNERRFIMDSEVEMDAVWQTVRNGGVGNGILVEEPTVESKYPASPAAVLEITFPIVCFQNGDMAIMPTASNGIGGGGFYASRLGMALIDIFYQLQIDGIGMLTLDGRSYERASDFPGINAVRIFPKAKFSVGAQYNRPAFIVGAVAGGFCTLTCATAGAKIVYTTDGSYPSDPAVAIIPKSVTEATPDGVPANLNAKIYDQPFAVEDGMVIRAAAYVPGYNLSPVRKFKITT